MPHDQTHPPVPRDSSPSDALPSQCLNPIQRRVLGILVTRCPQKVALTDVREQLAMQGSPREALLALADLGLVRAVMLGDERYWRATSAGVFVTKECRLGPHREFGT